MIKTIVGWGRFIIVIILRVPENMFIYVFVLIVFFGGKLGHPMFGNILYNWFGFDRY